MSSVHAFAQSPIGGWFFTFLGIGIAGTIYVILDRLDYLKSESQLESVLSRESSFLFNNLILVASCFSVLWGTLFPVISEAVTGEKISVDAPFFNKVNVPIALFLMLLTGVGPLIAWRRSSWESLKKAFLWPALAGVGIMVVLAALGMRHVYALISLGLCMFVAWTIAAEFLKGSRAIATRTGQNLAAAMVELTHRNTRRYGGYLVHMAIVIMFIGFTGKAFDKDVTVNAGVGESFHLGKYEMKIREIKTGDNSNYEWSHAKIDVYRGGSLVKTLEPERRAYKASRQPTSEVAIWRKLDEDLYLNFAGSEGEKAVIQAYVFPLVSWIWIGFWVLTVGTMICLVPSKTKQAAAPVPKAVRSQVEEASLVR